MLTYALDRRGELPLYEFLCRRIREDIREGRLRACLLYTSDAADE